MFKKTKRPIKRLSSGLIAILLIHLIQSLLVMPAPVFANDLETNANPSIVFSFGNGGDGRLGHGETTNQLEPKKIEELSNIHAIAAGRHHSLVLTVTGDVYSFGYGYDGQLGHGDTSNQLEPKKIEGLSNIQEIAAGSHHSLVLTVTGDVYSFGQGTMGELGHGGTTNQLEPKKIEGLSNIHAIAAGGSHSLVLTKSGDVYSFGFGRYGQLGHGNSVEKQLIPKKIVGLSNIQEIAAGMLHSLALTKSGDVYSFGEGVWGRLGHGDNHVVYEPKKIEGLSDIQAIVAGNVYSLALTKSGDVYSFGYGYDGQLGHGDTENQLVPKKIESLSNIQAISTFGAHTLVLTKSGDVYSFGAGSKGQLGHGDTVNQLLPKKIEGLSNVETISAGGDYSLVIVQILDSTIDPIAASFDTNIHEQQDITVTMELNGNTLISIMNGATPLVTGTDYIVNSNIVAITKSYMAALPIGTTTLEFGFSAGAAPILEILVSDSTPVLSDDAELIDLRVDGITVNGFTPAHTGTYAASISHAQTAVAIIYTTSSAHATVLVRGDTNLAIGDNTVTVTVTAQNGGTKDYTIKVVRAGAPSYSGGIALSGNADLQDLQIWVGDKKLMLSPSFASGMTDYTAYTEAEQVVIVAMKAHSAAKVIREDEVVADKINVDLEEGDNIWVLTVLAENGSNKKYTLHIYRETPQHGETGMPQHGETDSPTITLTDIAGHWAEQDIKRAVAQSIISGYPDGTFKPNNPVTRAEFTVMLADALKLEGEGVEHAFVDNEQIGAWAKQAVARAVQARIINGYEDGSFRPDAHITRAEMATMIAKALNVSRNANTRTNFADDKDIPKWAKGAVEAIRTLGIVSGRDNNNFVPNDTATRVEAIVMLLRIIEVRDQQ